MLSCTVLPAGAFGGERELGAGSQPAGPAAFGVCARSRRRAQCFEGAESKTARQGRRTDRAGGRLDLQRRGVGSKGARAGGMEALGSAGAGEGRAPTLPGGLVVRIRRSHRRGPGSIPGQGRKSSFLFLLPVFPQRGNFRSVCKLTFNFHMKHFRFRSPAMVLIF